MLSLLCYYDGQPFQTGGSQSTVLQCDGDSQSLFVEGAGLDIILLQCHSTCQEEERTGKTLPIPHLLVEPQALGKVIAGTGHVTLLKGYLSQQTECVGQAALAVRLPTQSQALL